MSKYLLIKCDNYNKEAVENFKAVELTKEELANLLTLNPREDNKNYIKAMYKIKYILGDKNE